MYTSSTYKSSTTKATLLNVVDNNAESGVEYTLNGYEKDDEEKGTYYPLYRGLDNDIVRWQQYDPKANPFESPYVSMAANPVMYNDVLGDIAVVDDAVISFFRGLFSKRKNFIKPGSSRLGNAFRRGVRQAKNSAKIYGGLFTADKNKSFGGKVLEITSRLTFQLPQTLLGIGYNQLANTFGNVKGVEYFHGATAIKGVGIKGGSVTLGSFISLGRTTPRFVGDRRYDPEANVGIGYFSYTFMHEYGHYLQSQRNGLSYFFKFGIQSILGSRKTEWDANQRAANYFHKVHPSFKWEPNYYKIGTWLHTYSKLPDDGKVHNDWQYYLLPKIPLLKLLKVRSRY